MPATGKRAWRTPTPHFRPRSVRFAGSGKSRGDRHSKVQSARVATVSQAGKRVGGAAVRPVAIRAATTPGRGKPKGASGSHRA